MKIARLLKTTLIVCVVSATLCLLAGCGGSGSGGVAATVNGEEISEEKVTKEVEQIRTQSGLSDTDQWGKFLVQNDMTPESVRETVINTLVDKLLIKNGAEELEIVVEDSEVDEAVESFKENYGDDAAWQNALTQAGFTEDSYRDTIYSSMIEQKVGDYFDAQAETSDEDNVNSAKTYASYYDGAKRTSHILIKVEDTNDEDAMAAALAQANDILAQVNNGMDFAEAARQYSQDEGSAENGGDVGWDKLNSFVTEYTDAIKDLEINQVSEPVKSEYGYHIIKVTDVYDAPEADEITSMDQIPEDFRSNIEDMAVSVKANDKYEDWLQELKDNAEIEINPMPSGLPYDINLKPYEDEKAETEAAAEAGDPSAVTEADATGELTEDVLADTDTTNPIEDAAITDLNEEEVLDGTEAAEGE